MSRIQLAQAMRTISLAGLFALAGLSAAGCIAVGGRSSYQAPTLGRQLQDLKVARDTGAITDAEFQDAKARLISGKCAERT